MIRAAPSAARDEEVLALLEPEVASWVRETFPAGLTPPQRQALPAVARGENVLVSSPTGSGKTLSAFLIALNDLFRHAKAGTLDDRVHVVYVSPLKALGNDIERNLRLPLEGISSVFRARGLAMPEIRVGVRTGDTPPRERQAQTRRPPHILITTPETLAIVLVAPVFSRHLAGARFVIVDEVHALADNKRGSHLSLTLERLTSLVERAGGSTPQRIGLSATISPLDEMARFVAGTDRPCTIVDVSHRKAIDLEVVSPVRDLVYASWDEVTDGLYALLDSWIGSHRTTLVFTNTRAGTERVVHQLKQRYGAKYAELAGSEESVDPEFTAPENSARAFVAAHHGSMSRESRLEVEEALKRGDLKCVVCSTSLELGIDIGSVDLVVLLGSPKGIARSLQRVGRAGHSLDALSRGKIVALDRDELVEATVLARLARERRLDAIAIPQAPLDVLCQHVLGLSLEGRWRVDDALALVRRAWPYRNLAEADFLRVLDYLSGRYEGLVSREAAGKIGYDTPSREFGRRGRLARVVYSTNIGTIPDSSNARVLVGGRWVGEIEEGFVESLAEGDVFMLGGETWRFVGSQGLRVEVEAAPSERPTVPQWGNEKLPLAADLAREVRALRSEVARRLEESAGSAHAFLRSDYHVSMLTAEAICGYVTEQAKFGGVPRDDEVLIEEFVDDELKRNFVFHTLHGRRANEVLARAFARRISEAKGTNVRVTAADNGFLLAVPRGAQLAAGEIKALFEIDLEKALRQAVEGSEILKRRFRQVAMRGLLILRNPGPNVFRRPVNAPLLFHALRRVDPHFPLVEETYREVFHDAFDLPEAQRVADAVRRKAARVRIERALKTPSPFAHGLVAMGARDAVLADDRRAIVRDLHERLQEKLRVRL